MHESRNTYPPTLDDHYHGARKSIVISGESNQIEKHGLLHNLSP